MKKIWIPLIVAAFISLISFIVVSAKEEIAKKADNETIMVIVQQMKEERKEDKEEDKEERQQQQLVNERVLESIQMLLIKMVEDK